MLLITLPSGARLPAGKQMVGGQTASSGGVRREDHLACIDSSRARSNLFFSCATSLALLPPVEILIQACSGHGAHIAVEQPGAVRRWSITSGTAPARKT